MDINQNVEHVLDRYMGAALGATRPRARVLSDPEKIDIYRRITPAGWKRFANAHGQDAVRSYVVEMEGLRKRIGA